MRGCKLPFTARGKLNGHRPTADDEIGNASGIWTGESSSQSRPYRIDAVRRFEKLTSTMRKYARLRPSCMSWFQVRSS